MNIVQLLKPALEILGGKLPADFLSGKPFNAKVLSVDGNRIRLDLGQGRTITAETDTPVKAGDSVRVVLQPPVPSDIKPSSGQGLRPQVPTELPQGGEASRPASPDIVRVSQNPPNPPSTANAPNAPGRPSGIHSSPVPVGTTNVTERAPMSGNPPPVTGYTVEGPGGDRQTAPPKTSPQPQAPPSPSRPVSGGAAPAVETPKASLTDQVAAAQPAKDPAVILKPLLSAGQGNSSQDFRALAQGVDALATRVQASPSGLLPVLPIKAEEMVGQLIQISRELKTFVMSMPDEAPLTEADVKSRIENSGMFLESRLASAKDVSGDVKGLLLRLEHLLKPLAGQEDQAGQAAQSAKPDHPAGLASRILTQTRLEISDIESRQAACIITRSGAEMPSISLPLTGEFRQSSLAITQEESRPRSGKAAVKRHRVLMQLEMSALGAVRVDALSGEGGIAIGFVVENEDVLQRVHSELENLRARLEEKGCPVAELIVRQGEVKFEVEPPPEQGHRYSRKA